MNIHTEFQGISRGCWSLVLPSARLICVVLRAMGPDLWGVGLPVLSELQRLNIPPLCQCTGLCIDDPMSLSSLCITVGALLAMLYATESPGAAGVRQRILSWMADGRHPCR